MVCFCLGITAVDPTKEDQDLLFARFISEERDEPPDIDVDFEHERREEVIQYVYERYGRERAAICATVIHYRPRSAIRDVGKALGLTEDVTAALADTVWGSWGEGLPDDQIRQAGLDPASPAIRRATDIATELLGFPRHLSQHVGGFVLTKQRLDETVPIGNAAMKDRTFIEWDKDDIDDLGLMKVDVLALGMLTAIRKGLDMLGIADIADIPDEDAGVYEMLCRADSVGVFQVESRAQMAMLPRLKPRRFYDLVIEVAIVRPGPIQGDMVHPYLRRREGSEAVEFPAPAPEHGPADELRAVLGKTLGVPLFQEQAMRLAMEAAKFTPEEANGLRRAMATFRHLGDVGVYGEKFVEGMAARGYDPAIRRSAASARSKASAPTAFPRATRSASPSWSTSRPGSNAIGRTSSAPPCSTASRWASTSPPNWSATPASTASRCGRSISWRASGTARWKRWKTLHSCLLWRGGRGSSRHPPRLAADPRPGEGGGEAADRRPRSRRAHPGGSSRRGRGRAAGRWSCSPRPTPCARSVWTGAPDCGR